MLIVGGITVFVKDERYKCLMKTLDIPRGTRNNYKNSNNNILALHNNTTLKDCISRGDGTPAQLNELWCSDSMERYRQSVPAFTYNAAVFPPYGDTIHHWHILTYNPVRHVSLIIDSKEEICDYINNTLAFYLHFVPLPDTLQ